MSDSTFVSHCPCPACGSSDAGAMYTDGHMHCHKCGHTTSATKETEPTPRKKRVSKLLTGLEHMALQSRKLSFETCKKFDYATGNYRGKPCQVANYRSPDGRLVAQKVRLPGKDFVFLGDADAAGLYGQHLWKPSKMLIVTEGEIDALSVSEVQSNKWPVVSVPTGAKGAKKALMKQLDWLEQFESVVLMFDNDTDGIDAARECAELFTPGKCRIAALPLKDANEMLKAGRGSELVPAAWNAPIFRPDGIITGDDIWEQMVSAPKSDHLEYPFPGMNDMLLGARRGEVIVFTAGTGAGKTEVVTQIVHHWIKRHNEKVGCLYLESRVSDIGWKMTGLELGKRLLIDRDAASQEEAKAAFDRLKNNLVMYDHFGSTDPDNLFNKIRYMVRGLGCGTIVLDHISIVVSGIEDGDERRLIDNMMTRIASLVQELNCRLIVISHLKRPDGTPFEEGGQITLAHLRGSASIAQLGYDIVALERNQQDEKEKHLTHIRILKCRWTGRTGSAGYLSYDEGTGLLTAVSPDFQDDTAEPNTDFE